MTPGKMWAMRAAAAIAAALLVTAFSVALLYPAMTSLGELVGTLDGGALASAQAFARLRLPGWVWPRVAVPLLTRPAWLLPMALGVIAIGIALTLRSHRGAPRPRRRRG